MISKVYHITFQRQISRRLLHFTKMPSPSRKSGERPSYATFDVGGIQFGFEPHGKLEFFLLVDGVDKAYKDHDGNKFTIETFKK